MKTKKISILLIVSLLIVIGCGKKDDSSVNDMKSYYSEVVKELSSVERYAGRNLHCGGVYKASDYIVSQLQTMGIKPSKYPSIQNDYPNVVGIFGAMDSAPYDELNSIAPIEDVGTNEYFQRFSFYSNIYDGEALFEVDGQKWEPTVDYVFKEFSPTSNVKGDIVFLDDEQAYSEANFVNTLNDAKFRDKFVVIDHDLFNKIFATKGERFRREPYRTALLPIEGLAGIIFEYNTRPPFFMARSSYQANFPVVAVQKPFPRDAKSAYIKLDAKLQPYPANNIIAQIEGKKNPDSIVVFMAHYDHLGAMGSDNIFAGANDNASGVAMLLSLAKYYSKPENCPDNSMIFVFFDAEEANLLGSWYLSENPTFPLENVKLFLNFDMIGDDAENPQERVLNYQVSEKALPYLYAVEQMNKSIGHFSSLYEEEVNDDSDNYPFHIKGLPVLYFSINGKYFKDYHTPRDTNNVDANGNFNALFEFSRECVNLSL